SPHGTAGMMHARPAGRPKLPRDSCRSSTVTAFPLCSLRELYMSRPLRLAINGYGRIGRCVLRALHESTLRESLQVVAINEPADLETMVYLSQFDSTHGVFPGKVEQSGNGLVIDGQLIQVSHARKPEEVDWKGLGIDLLLECSGR